MNDVNGPVGDVRRASRNDHLNWENTMEEIIRETAPEAAEATAVAGEASVAAAENLQEIEKTKKKLKKSEKSVRRYEFFFLRVLILLVILWVLFFKIIGITTMPSDDMYPRFSSGDLLLFYRLNVKNVRSQDVIVVESETPDSNGEKEIFVCRVVAVAGDTVEITDDENLIVNGNTKIEPNIFYRTPRYEGFVEYPVTLQEGQVFVLADKREGGEDSRYFGPISVDNIVGTVITVARRNNL